MGFFDFIKDKTNQEVEYLNINGGMRLLEAEVDVMFIIKNNHVVYINDHSQHLFKEDKDGDLKLSGRIGKLLFYTKSKNNIIEVFVAFDKQDSHALFTMGIGIEERLNYVGDAIFEYFHKNGINNVFNYSEPYQLQFEDSFGLYQKKDQFFMVNKSQEKSYILNKKRILRSNDKEQSVDKLKEIFWR